MAPVLIATVIALTLYWWWPGIVGRGTEYDESPAIVVVGGGQLERSSEKVLRRLREEGYSSTWGGSPGGWCELSDVLATSTTIPSRALVMYAPPGANDCASAAELAGDILAEVEAMNVRAVLVVGLEEGDRDDPVVRAMVDRGLTVVDPVSLIGEPTTVGARVDCLWWDDCVIEGANPGYVIVRDEDGLTAAGQQRLARLIVATVQ